MKKNFIASFVALMMAVTFTSCSSKSVENSNGEKKETKTEENSSDQTLVVYSPNSEGLVNSIIPAFEEKTGITVELQQAGTGELFTKLNGEKTDPVADVMWGGGYTTYNENKDLFEEYVSKYDKDLPEEYQNKEGYRTSYGLDGSVLIVNKDLIGDIKIEGYKDLLNPKLKGKIASADPTSSSSAFAHLTNMLKVMGGYESDESWNYVKELYSNVDGKIQSSSSQVYKTVADGEMTVGLTYEDPAAQLLKDGADNVELIYQNEGVVFLPAGVGIIKGSKHIENAKKFIDFVISKEGQDIIGSQTTLRPVLPSAKISDGMKKYDEIKTEAEDYDYIIKNTEDIASKFKDIFTEVSGK
ncbi:MAG: ABC transporter substrate-binding protein [Peptoniphilaceae bacterium]|nr:ABC transporter substrate-binding protein [Peptoniphilaceae bacterium]MDD7383639.1 ABC transporter substrate-binding protein [Peptoniphilaceae bacterium]MDY3737810.1 ABC transporter substrate-binding protein [Peptoniphilaceae bacterium]